MTNLKRFQLKAPPVVIEIFDAICESAHVDRDTGFNFLMLEFFDGYPSIQTKIEHPDFTHWQQETREFLMKSCP